MLAKEQIDFLNKYVQGTWKFKPRKGLVDVNGDFLLNPGNQKGLMGISFGYVTGHFKCSYNQLTSLKGAPSKVGGDFNCSGNKLASLEGAPSEVGGNFKCNCNQLTSLKGAPTKIKKVFSCFGNNLTSLKGIPSSVGCFASDFFYFDEGFDRFTQKTLLDIYLVRFPIWGIRIKIPSLPFWGVTIKLSNESRTIIRNSFTKKTLNKYTFIDF